MKISSNTDYSSLLGSSDSTQFSLADYASIKNGSYGKLMKAYYGKNNSSSVSGAGKTLTEKQSLNYTETKKAAGDLKSSIESLTSAINDDADSETIAKAASDFVEKYNSLIKAAGNSDNKSITRFAQNIVNEVGANLSMLSKAGITLSEKSGEMSVDTEKFKENTSAIKALFGKSGSFGDVIATKASSIEKKATSALNVSKTYNQKAGYSDSDAVGKLYDSYN